MKKLNTLPESEFLKLLFSVWTASFFVAAVLMPDRATMFSGLWNIISSPCKLSTNNFWIGGYAAAFLNVGLCTLVFLLLIFILKVKPGKVTGLGFILIPGFSFWGINILNLWFSLPGVVLYCLIKKDKLQNQYHAMLFTTGAAPLISELLLRYPNPETIGFSFGGFVLALAVGAFIGITVPAGLAHAPAVHKGFDLYSAALPVGMMTVFLNATLYKTMGMTAPAGPDASTYQIASPAIVNSFFGIMFAACVVAAFLMGADLKKYWKLLTGPKPDTTIAGTYGNAIFLLNMGVYGFFILTYYNAIGASWNSITCGLVLTMLACCNDGAHPGNVWPVMVSYFVASNLFAYLSGLVGGSFAGAINAQGIVVALCYASGLSPITSKYGCVWGFLAGVAHYLLVTSIPATHGGFCLYNGGFTAALICLLFMPQIERFAKEVKR